MLPNDQYKSNLVVSKADKALEDFQKKKNYYNDIVDGMKRQTMRKSMNQSYVDPTQGKPIAPQDQMGNINQGYGY